MVNIDKIKTSLLASYPLFGRIITSAKFIEQDYGTCETNGKNIYYNKTFLEKLTEDQQKFTIAHEVCHIAFDHIKRCKNKNLRLWNIATDAVINALLKKDGLTAPEGIIDKPEAVNFSAEKFYEKLIKEEQTKKDDSKNKSQKDYNKGQSIQDSNKSQNNNHNEKDSQNSNIKDSEDFEENDKGNNKSNDEFDENNVSSHKRWLDEEKDDNKKVKNGTDSNLDKENHPNKEINETKSFKENKKEKLVNLKKLKDKLEKIKTAGPRLPGEETDQEKINLSNIEGKTNLLDWKRILQVNTYSDYDWSFENATIEYGVVTPHLEELPHNETEILLDTSGSVDEELLKNFLRECKNILKDSILSVGCFDTKFYGFQPVKNMTDIDNLVFEGRGGTDFDVAVNSFTPHANNKIIFTDGYAETPKKKSNIIWMVYDGVEISPPGGKVIYIDSKSLEKTKTKKHSNF